MSYAITDSRPPPAAGIVYDKEFARTEQEVIDEDYHVSIYKTNSSSNWYIQYNHPSGGQRKKSLRTKNIKEARRKAWETVSKLHTGEIGPTALRGPRIKDAMEGFLNDRRRIGRRKSTITEYRRTLEQLHQFATESGITRLDHLTPTHMEQFETLLREKGIALKRETRTRGRPAKKNKSTSVHEKIKLVKSLTKWAVEMRKLRENPISGFKLPADGDPDNYCYKPAEVQEICKHAGPFFGDVFRFLALTGLRQGELMWLTKGDVDLTFRTVRIRAKVFSEELTPLGPQG